MSVKWDDVTSPALAARLTRTLRRAGCDGCLAVMDIDSGRAVGLHPHQLAVAASVFKVAVALELYRQAEEEGLALTEPIQVTAENRTVGPSGLSLMHDPATLSLRDLASLMLSISDNAATDAILARVGLARVNATLRALGLHSTVIVSDLRGLIDSVVADAGVASWEALWTLPPEEREARLDRCRALQLAHATRTTPSDMARLLRSIWRDEAAPAAACAEVRRLLGQQPSYRIAAGFPPEVAVQAKSGSLLGRVRNEIGVVTYPDGQRYAVAVFTRPLRHVARQPAVDAAIGTVAALAVAHLRQP